MNFCTDHRDQSRTKDIILIIEASPEIDVWSNYFDPTAFELWIARDAESAIRKIEYLPPDLILLDINSHEIDALETCKKLKNNPLTREIPIILMTSVDEMKNSVKYLSIGAVDYLTKPVHKEEVLARVRLHLKQYKLTQLIKEKTIRLQEEIAEKFAVGKDLYEKKQELEQSILQRTSELSKCLQKLKDAKNQLIHSEKMSSLGHLVAGVAHEINNPISFIQGNISYVEEYINNLLTHLQLYQHYYPNPGPEIEKNAEEIDLEYLVLELPDMITGMKVGTDRIRSLSLSLRNFCRADTSSKMTVNIHEGLESTLLILQYRLKARGDRSEIKVIKEYGVLPPVDCYPGPLNQVFMNILANAVDALDSVDLSSPQLAKRVDSDWSSAANAQTPDNPQEQPPELRRLPNTPTIRIKTEIHQSNFVVIRIADNGPGLTQEVKERIFEPLFTTKPIGKGTGLGLSISYYIVVDKHGGELKCISQPNQGAEFIIKIPVKQPHENLRLFESKSKSQITLWSQPPS